MNKRIAMYFSLCSRVNLLFLLSKYSTKRAYLCFEINMSSDRVVPLESCTFFRSSYINVRSTCKRAESHKSNYHNFQMLTLLLWADPTCLQLRLSPWIRRTLWACISIFNLYTGRLFTRNSQFMETEVEMESEILIPLQMFILIYIFWNKNKYWWELESIKLTVVKFP